MGRAPATSPCRPQIPMIHRRGLYPIVDVDALEARGVGILPFADAVLAIRPPLLQLRAKSLPPREVLALLRELAPRCRAVETLLIANDRADLALLAGADGVHVGQEDLPVAEVRRWAPRLRIGLSTHDLGQLRGALAERPAYVALGPVFPTVSKARPEPAVGLELLARGAAMAAEGGCPLVAIGGIDLDRAATVAAHAPLTAVIGDLLADGSAADAVTRRALRLHRALGGD